MTQIKSILFVATIWRTLHAFIAEHAEYLQERGWTTHAAANLHDMEEGRLSQFDSVHHLPWSRSARRPDLMISGGRALTSVVRDLRPDIVHFHTPIASAVGRVAMRTTRPRPVVVHTAHGFHVHPNGSDAQNGAATVVERFLGMATDHLFTINEYDTTAAQTKLGYSPDSVTGLHGIGIDLAHYARTAEQAAAGRHLRQQLEIPEDVPVVGFVGALNRNKRPFDIVSAMGSLQSLAHLVIAGDGPLMEELALNAGPRVHFLGRVEDIRPVVAASDLIVSCSKREGLPRSLLESLAGATPIITSACRGGEDLAADASAVFPVGDTTRLVTILERFLRDAEARRSLLAIQTAGLERYDFDHVAIAQLAVYERLLQRSE